MCRVKKQRGGNRLHRKFNLDLIDDNFRLYSNKTKSDYWITNNGLKVPTQTTIMSNRDKGLYSIIKESNSLVTLYKKEFIERLSPDNIDINKFWKKATDNFPLFSIAGGVQNFTTIDEINQISVHSANNLGVLKLVDYVHNQVNHPKFLEIGPGHGGIQKAIASSYGDDNYYAIDVNPLFSHPRIFKNDGKNIPDVIPFDLDCVYSINVFQHLSKSQRTSYYKQIFTALKTGGIFIFGMFVINDENKNWPVWGARDEEGKYYCHFFKQLTEIDWEENLLNELHEIGFDVMPIPDTRKTSHYLAYVCQTT